MCYTYLVPRVENQPRYDLLDELLTRIHVVRQRPEWRRRLLGGVDQVAAVSTLRVLRAVEQCERAGRAASVGDVAQYMAVEHSTASRTVGSVVASGLLGKSVSAEDQRRCRLTLTDTGRKALAKVARRRQEVIASVIADWPDADVDTLVTLLDRFAADLEHGPGS